MTAVLLELSEVFVCPACRPAQGLVVLVDELRGRRVLRGHLGCPECELRVPIRDGVLRFDLAETTEKAEAGGTEGGGVGPPGGRRGDPGAGGGRRTAGEGASPGTGPLAGAGRREGATRLAALLGADGAEGCLLLGPGLEELAVPVSRLAPGAEVLALETTAAGPADDGGVSRAVGVHPGALPVVSGRLSGVALLRPRAEEAVEGARVVGEGGRVVLLEPTAGAREALEAEPVRIAAADEGAVVAVREPGAARARP